MDAAKYVESSEEEPSFSSDDEYSPLRFKSHFHTKSSEPSKPMIDIVSFALGAFMMAPFMVIICAAEDMLSGSHQATGLVYIAASAPSCLVKVFFLCFPKLTKPAVVTKTLLMYMLIVAGMFFIAMSQTSYTSRFAGVCLASVGMAIGEIYMLSLTTETFHKSSLVSFLGGSAAGGVLSALPYVGMTSWSDINPRAALLVPIVWPTLYLLVFAVLHIEYLKKNYRFSATHEEDDVPQRHVCAKQLQAVWKAMDVLSLLFLSNFALFLSLGAIFTTLVFSSEHFAAREHYQHYVLSSTVGQFFGRSLMSLVFAKKPKLPTTPFQAIGSFLTTFFMLLLFFASWHHFMKNIWGAFTISFLQGISLGILTVVSYHKISKDTKSKHIQGLLLTASLCETFGILCAGLIGLHTEPSLFSHCRFDLKYNVPMYECLTRAFNPLLWLKGKNI